MYIYQSMPDGITGPNGENLAEQVRIIEVDGAPAPVVGIRYKADSAPPPVGIERTKSGRLVDTGPQSEDVDDQEYWADKPSGFCGGQRLKQTLAEDLAVCILLRIFWLSRASTHILPYNVTSLSRDTLPCDMSKAHTPCDMSKAYTV